MFKNKLVPYNLSEFNFNFPQLIVSYIDKIVGLLTLGGAIWGIRKMRPKIESSKTLTIYIDYAENQLIEEKEYEFAWGRIFWGRMFSQKVTLPKIPRDSTFQLLYKPSISYKQPLPKDIYEVLEKSTTRNITLIDKKFFDEAETNCVNVVTTTLIQEEYRTKVNCTYQGNEIIITNDNYTKICNYPVELPRDFEIDRITVFNYVSEIVNPTREASEGIKLIVEIPAKQASNPGRKVIPLRRA